MLYLLHPPLRQEVGGIVKVLTLNHRILGGRAHYNCNALCRFGQFQHRMLCQLDKILELEEIAWGIAHGG